LNLAAAVSGSFRRFFLSSAASIRHAGRNKRGARVRRRLRNFIPKNGGFPGQVRANENTCETPRASNDDVFERKVEQNRRAERDSWWIHVVVGSARESPSATDPSTRFHQGTLPRAVQRCGHLRQLSIAPLPFPLCPSPSLFLSLCGICNLPSSEKKLNK